MIKLLVDANLINSKKIETSNYSSKDNSVNYAANLVGNSVVPDRLAIIKFALSGRHQTVDSRDCIPLMDFSRNSMLINYNYL